MASTSATVTTKRVRAAHAKNWCFTLQSDPAKGQHIAWPTIKECPVDWWVRHEDNGLVFLVCQVEKAPATGKYHVQGYVCFAKNTTLPTLKRALSATAHWESARGTPLENQAYCTKDESRVNGPWQFGVLPQGAGSRSDLRAIYGYLQAEKSNAEILETTEGKSAKFEKHINYIRFTLNESRSNRQVQGVRVVVLYGPTGVGKTYAAVNFFGLTDYHLQECPSSKDSRFWFDGYQSQRTLILDDFSGDFCNYRYLLRVLDKYKLKCEIKGGHVWALWTTVVITTNVHPSNWYAGVNTAPLQRRITEIRYCENQGTYKMMDWAEHAEGDFIAFATPPVAPPAPSTSTSEQSTQPYSPDIVMETQREKRVRRKPTDLKEKDKDKDDSNSDMTDPDA